MAWLQPQPTCKRPDTFTQTVDRQSSREPCNGRGGPYISAESVLKHLFVEAQIGDDLPQLRVLISSCFRRRISVGSSPSYLRFQLK